MSGIPRATNLGLVFTLILASLCAFLPPVPALADSVAGVALTSATIPVNSTGTTDVIVNGVSGPDGLGAYDVNIRFDNTKLAVVRVDGGAVPFNSTPVNNAEFPFGATSANGLGKLNLNSFQAQIPGPTGNVKVATVTWKALAGGVHDLSLAVTILADIHGIPISPSSVLGGKVYAIAPTPGPDAPPTPTPASVSTPTPAPTATPSPAPLITFSPTPTPLATPVPNTPASVSMTSAVIPLGGTGTTDVFVNGVSGPPGLGAYDMAINFDVTKVNVVQVSGGAAPFDAIPVNNANTPVLYASANATGELHFNAFHTRYFGPTGNIKVATITWIRLGGGIQELRLAVVTLAEVDGDSMPFSSVTGGRILPSIVVASLLEVNAGGAGVVAISIAANSPSPLKSYALTVSFDPATIAVDSVGDGDAPFGPPAVKTIDPAAGTVVLEDSIAGGFPGVEAVVARLMVRGISPGPANLAVTVRQLKDAGGGDIPISVDSGPINVTLPVVKAGSATFSLSRTIAIPVSVQGLAGQSLRAYDLEIAFDKTRIKVNGIGNGDPPFGGPATKTVDNNAGKVRLAGAMTAGFPTGDVTLAYLEVEPLSLGTSTLTLTVRSLVSATGEAIAFQTNAGAVTVVNTSVEIGQALTVKGATVEAPLTVKQAPGLVGGKGGLTSYNLGIDFDPGKLQYNGISPPDASPQFPPPRIDVRYDPSGGHIFLSQALTTSAGPAGDVLLAKLRFAPLVDGRIPLTLAETPSLTDGAGNVIIPGSVHGLITSVAVEGGSASARLQGSATVPITVKFPAGATGLAAYQLTVRFDNKMLRVDRVDGGAAPFGTQAVKSIDNAAGTVTLAGGQSVSAPSGSIVVATLGVTGLAPTGYYNPGSGASTSVYITVTGLSDTAGAEAQGLPAQGTPGSVVVHGAVVTMGSAGNYAGEKVIVSLYVSMDTEAAPQGLQAYQIRIDFNNSQIRFEDAGGGLSPFNQPPTLSPSPVVNSVTLTGSHSQSPAPLVQFTVANLTFTILSTAYWVNAPLTVTINSLTDGSGVALPAIARNGYVQLMGIRPTPSPGGGGGGAPGVPPTPPPPPPGGGGGGAPGPPGQSGPPTRAPTATPTPSPSPAPTITRSPTPVLDSSFRPAPTPAATPAPTATPPLNAGMAPGTGGGSGAGGGGGSAPPVTSAPAPGTASPSKGNAGGQPPAKSVSGQISGPVVNSKSEARDASGALVRPATGQKIALAQIDGALTLVMPVSLPRDAVLKTFNDPDTGVSFDNNTLTIPIKNDQGSTQMTITATTGRPMGTGSSATATVEKLELRSAPAGADFSGEDPKVGVASASVNVELKSLPEGAGFSFAVSKNPDPTVQQSLSSTLPGNGRRLADSALTLSGTRTGLSAGDTGAATVTMSAGKPWVQSFGAANIAIARTADNGISELLDTRVAAETEGSVTFEAASPSLSTFTLLALQGPAPAAGTPPNTPAGPAISPSAPTAVPQSPAAPASSPGAPVPFQAGPVGPAPSPAPTTPVVPASAPDAAITMAPTARPASPSPQSTPRSAPPLAPGPEAGAAATAAPGTGLEASRASDFFERRIEAPAVPEEQGKSIDLFFVLIFLVPGVIGVSIYLLLFTRNRLR